MHWAIIMAAILCQVRAPQAAIPVAASRHAPTAAAPVEAGYKIRRELPPDSQVTSPRDAVTLALDDLELIDEADQTLTRYVWVPDWIEPASGFAQVSFVANSTLSRTSNIVQPTVVADGKLVRLDLSRYAGRKEQINQIAALYELLAERDSYFNVKLKLRGDVAIILDENAIPRAGDPVEVRLQSGNWGPAKFEGRSGQLLACNYQGQTYRVTGDKVRFRGQSLGIAKEQQPRQTFAAAPYLGPDGSQLFALTDSAVPIMRLDEWVAFTFSTVNGGLYYPLTGIKGNLEDTIREFCGNDAAEKVRRTAANLRQAEAESHRTGESIAKIAGRLDPELAKSKCYIATSGVTGRQRLVLFVTGTGVPPASGQQVVAVTFDLAEDNTDPENDPLRSPTKFERYDGGEAIFPGPNGLLVYVVFDAQDRVIDSVPDKVAFDTAALKVRSNVSTARVFSGLSCANCHEQDAKNWGWQPVPNDLQATARSLTTLLDDKGSRNRTEAIQRYAAQYQGESRPLLNLARLSYQHQAHLATNQPATRETIAGLADSYWGYWYDRVTARTAAADLGQSLSEKDAQLFLIRAIEPEKFDDDRLFEDAFLAHLKDAKHGTPAQWRAIIQNVGERLLVQTAKETIKRQGEEREDEKSNRNPRVGDRGAVLRRNRSGPVLQQWVLCA